MRLRMKFDRIGRSPIVGDLEVEEVTLEDVCRAVYRYALPRLGSKEVEVSIDLQARKGSILVGGVRTAGTFTVEPNLPEGVRPHPMCVGYAADDPVQFENAELPAEFTTAFVVGHCGHRVARSEWLAGLRFCEHCGEPVR